MHACVYKLGNFYYYHHTMKFSIEWYQALLHLAKVSSIEPHRETRFSINCMSLLYKSNCLVFSLDGAMMLNYFNPHMLPNSVVYNRSCDNSNGRA